AYVVRGVGLIDKVEDIGNILIKTVGNTPVLVKHVADVSISAKPRLGQAGLDENPDVVEGIVIMLRGENPADVIENLRERIDELNNRVLPSNVQIVPFIDRTELVSHTVHTVSKNLIEG